MRRELNIAKWVLLVFVCCELVSLMIAFVMRFCVDPEGHYSNFDDEEVRRMVWQYNRKLVSKRVCSRWRLQSGCAQSPAWRRGYQAQACVRPATRACLSTAGSTCARSHAH